MSNTKGNGYEAVDVLRSSIMACMKSCGWSVEEFCACAGRFGNTPRFPTQTVAKKVESLMADSSANVDIPAQVIAFANWVSIKTPKQIQERFRQH